MTPPRIRFLHATLGLVAVGAGIHAFVIAGALASTPCKEARGNKDRPTAPLAGAMKPDVLPAKVRPYRFSESTLLGSDTDPNNAESILCVCANCESKWLDRALARPGADATQASPTLPTTRCRSRPTHRGYLIGALLGKEIVMVERTERRTALRWFDVDRMNVKKEQTATTKDDFLGGGNLTSDAGDGVIAGGSVLFTNTIGALRSYPSRADLPGKSLSGIYSPEIGLGVLTVGSSKYAAVASGDGVIYRRFVSMADQDLQPKPRNLRRIWASQRWILRNFAPYPAIWTLSQADGSNEQFLAYGGLGACGQLLMGDYALNLEASSGYAVLALSLLPDVPDYRIRGIPLDRLYCVAGDGGVLEHRTG
jgi:hypothetical protein